VRDVTGGGDYSLVTTFRKNYPPLQLGCALADILDEFHPRLGERVPDFTDGDEDLA